MKLREFRRTDGPRLFGLLKTEFPQEEAMLGMRPEGFETVVRRLFRVDARLLLGLLRGLRRSPFHLYVIEDGGTIAATTLLSFTPAAGFLSTVIVAPEFRRRGFARQLLEVARQETARRRRPYLALRVLSSNAAARTLYTSAGYGELERQRFAVHEDPSSFREGPAAGGVRPFVRADAAPLAELANRLSPEKVREVLPVRPRDLGGRTWADRVFEAESAAWVVDRGHGPEAYVSASATPTTAAAHLGTPLVGESVEPSRAADLVRTACSWLAARTPVRLVTTVPEDRLRARRALEEVGFHDAIPHLTLYRPSG